MALAGRTPDRPLILGICAKGLQSAAGFPIILGNKLGAALRKPSRNRVRSFRIPSATLRTNWFPLENALLTPNHD